MRKAETSNKQIPGPASKDAGPGILSVTQQVNE